MILKSEPAPVHKADSCGTCKSDAFQDIVAILHAADKAGMVPAMLCLVEPETGEIATYTYCDVDADELISTLAKTVVKENPLQGELLTAIRSGERGN